MSSLKARSTTDAFNRVDWLTGSPGVSVEYFNLQVRGLPFTVHKIHARNTSLSSYVLYHMLLPVHGFCLQVQTLMFIS